MNSRATQFGILVVALFVAMPAIGVAQSTTWSAPAKSGEEAIPVHGEWSITVTRNGTPVERREFSNALVVPDGAAFLRGLLTNTVTLTGWLVGLRDTETSGALCPLDGNEFTDLGTDIGQFNCVFVEVESFLGGVVSDARALSGGEWTGKAVGELTASAPSSGEHQLALVLEGASTALRDGTIDEVGSLVAFCPGDGCTSSSGQFGLPTPDVGVSPFTRKDVSSEPISVLADDEIHVTVVIGFFTPNVELRSAPSSSPTDELQAPSLPSPSGETGG